MHRILVGLSLSLLASVSMAAPDPQCAEHDRLRTQRDKALAMKNLKLYCDALAGLNRLMPATPPAHPRLQCEYNAATMNTQTWLGIRPSVISTMRETFDQQCK